DGSVTGTNKNQLAAYLRSYFITSTMNSFTSYPYLGSSCKGEFYTTGTEKMQIEDNGAALSVRFNAEGSTFVQVNNQYHYLPFAFSDGCFHLIDGILK
ncbi:MAG: fasciclin, partial [Bacteroidaceae bacterium]|nr:fasciclin [Bacteroidaceae bacterium]